MFHGIQAKSVTVRLTHHPARPVFYLFGYRAVAIVDIRTHQVIEVAVLIVNLIVPAIAGVVVNNFEHPVLRRVFNAINAAEAFIIPNKF